MISIRTAVSASIAGIGTFAGGAMAANAPKPSWADTSFEPTRPLAAGIAMVSMMGGITGALTGPGASLRPVMGVLAAGLGGTLLGQHVAGPLLGRG